MGKKAKGHNKIIGELRNQLLIQAERLGIKDRYTPLWFTEEKALALSKILAEFYAERSNLEYELNLLGSDKKDILIKLEKLHGYIRKAESLKERYLDKFEKIIDKNYKLSEYRQKLRCLEKTEVKAVA
ncbi:MAG: hypothetical protein KKA31_05500 [Candidatus Margulisbacteria bacterium]|nr:hypothetical protein [Candidatus Margulisiibacteriota bacterium]